MCGPIVVGDGVWWSDHGGQSYSMAPDFGCELPQPALNGGCGEREIVELRNGSLLAIIRGGRKVSALSHDDSGVTWVNQRQTTKQGSRVARCRPCSLTTRRARCSSPARATGGPQTRSSRWGASTRCFGSRRIATRVGTAALCWCSGLVVTLPAPRRLLLCYSSGPGPPDSSDEPNAIQCARFASPPPRPALKTGDGAPLLTRQQLLGAPERFFLRTDDNAHVQARGNPLRLCNYSKRVN
jgi:hypothetical protein